MDISGLRKCKFLPYRRLENARRLAGGLALVGVSSGCSRNAGRDMGRIHSPLRVDGFLVKSANVHPTSMGSGPTYKGGKGPDGRKVHTIRGTSADDS